MNFIEDKIAQILLFAAKMQDNIQDWAGTHPRTIRFLLNQKNWVVLDIFLSTVYLFIQPTWLFIVILICFGITFFVPLIKKQS
jgi:hypothetical protein